MPKYNRCCFGPDEYITTVSGSGVGNTYAMASLNAGWCARFFAESSKDIKTVYIRWATVATPGTVRVRIETIDPTTGKPTGTLYDANATKDITPTSGWQAVTFDTLPTTGLTYGTEYALVLLTTVAGTTQSLTSYTGIPLLPGCMLTAADGTTRSNFAEVVGSSPVCSFILEDDSESGLGCCPFGVRNFNNTSGLGAAGLYFEVPPSTLMAIDGAFVLISRFNTPAGDVRFRILNSSNEELATCTIDKDSLANSTGRRLRFVFSSILTLTTGSYRAVVDAQTTTSSDWRITSLTARSSAIVPTGFCLTTTSNITATPIVWTNTTTDLPGVSLTLVDMVGIASSNMLLLGVG